MRSKIRELLQQRAGLINEARCVLERAEGENRDLNAEERQQYDRLLDDANGLSDRAQRLERQAALDEELEREPEGGHREPPEGRGGQPGETPEAREEERAARAFAAWLTGEEVRGEDLQLLEQRALSVGTSTEGGELVPPEQFVRRLIQAVDDRVYIRQWATKIPIVGAQSLGAPSLDADPADSDWTTEIQTGSEDSSMLFGKRTMTPNPLAKRIKVSNRLLRLAASSEDIVRMRLAYKFAVSQEKAFLTGDGNGKPLGVFVASASGIPAGRDVSADNTTTAVTFDGLMNAKYALKGAYWDRARWLYHRDVLKTIAKIKGGDGQYVWRESTRQGEPDRLLGIPVFMSEFSPSTMTAGNYVGILGDFSNYWIADDLALRIQRLNELYAETAQTGFIGRMELDGAPVLGEAFVRVKLAT